MPSSSRKKSRTASAGEAMKLVSGQPEPTAPQPAKPQPAKLEPAKPEPALTYAARDFFAFVETAKPAQPAVEGPQPLTAPPPTAAKSLSSPPEAAKSLSSPPEAAAKPISVLPQAPGKAAARPGSKPAMFGDLAALTEFGTGNVEAVAAAGAILAKGFEEISQSVVELGQHNLQSSVALATAAFGTTTLRQLVELQTGFARASFDRLLAEGSRVSEISMKTADAALQPLQARVTKALATLTAAA